MKKGSTLFLEISMVLLIGMWAYAVTVKLLAFDHFRVTMSRQPVGWLLRMTLTYALLPAEALTAVLLTVPPLKRIGLALSAGLLTVFSGYIFLGIIHVFKQVPCSCGGILEHLGWPVHLLFNLFFLAITVISIKIIKRKEQGDIR